MASLSKNMIRISRWVEGPLPTEGFQLYEDDALMAACDATHQ
jgi:hypothetical protein